MAPARQPLPRASAPRRAARAGQAVVFLLAALVVLLSALLWNADLHALVVRKTRAQNAGDAASLAAARWQANAINLVGDLNLLHLAALDAGDYAAVGSITTMQARLCFAGPLTAFAAAQAAAKKNGIPEYRDFTELVRRHAAEVLKYASIVAGGTALPEPYPGAWHEYHDALLEIASHGVAAGPDNARFFADPGGDHILLDKDFYYAVEGREWCYFFLNCSTGGGRTILDDFTGHDWFAPLPPPRTPNVNDSEFFGIGLYPRTTPLLRFGALADHLQSSGYASGPALSATNAWYFYSPSTWYSPWPGMSPDSEDPLPLAGPVREEYDYAGADSVVRLYAPVSLMAVGRDGEDRSIAWTAAAKPFGFLRVSGRKEPPPALGLVLPSFSDVRLIPMDAATSGADGSFDIDFRTHCVEHLPEYLETGALVESCRYCRDIRTFEDPAFRKKGSDWLLENSYKCTLPSHGRGHGGGTRRGH